MALNQFLKLYHDTVKYNLDIYINIALKKEIAN